MDLWRLWLPSLPQVNSFMYLVDFLRHKVNKASISKGRHCSGYYCKNVTKLEDNKVVLRKWDVSALLTAVSEQEENK